MFKMPDLIKAMVGAVFNRDKGNWLYYLFRGYKPFPYSFYLPFLYNQII